jgi:putative ATPase
VSKSSSDGDIAGEHTGLVSDLFSDAASVRAEELAPLPHRVRPRMLDELVGQDGVLGPGTALRRAIEEGRAPSMILHGPPGVGKTTVARIVADMSAAAFEELSAVSARVDDVRAVLARARDRLGGNGVRTILFIDEIHRFDKRQQDSVLHAVEDGLVTLIGATTENPYFEVNQALLSRCTVIELESLTVEDLHRVVERGAAALDADVPDDVADEIARRAGGDARTALQTLELAWETARASGEGLGVAQVEDAARKRPLRYDRAGDRHYDLASALIKSMRGGDPDAAVYYLAAMLEGGEDARFIARRIVIAASEDVGNADPRALLVAVAAANAVEHVGLPEAQLNLAQAAIYVARAPKSNASAQALWSAQADVRREGIADPPGMLRGSGYRGARARGHGEGYVSPHDDPTRLGIDHLPESLRGRTYYRPSGNGEETEEATRGDRHG